MWSVIFLNIYFSLDIYDENMSGHCLVLDFLIHGLETYSFLITKGMQAELSCFLGKHNFCRSTH